jgi:hypothetical protein
MISKKISKPTMLITGHFGFSKTFSAMLYSILIDHVINYRIKYPDHSDKLPKHVKSWPKLFYWTIDKTKFTNIPND